jgi:hypothetical protein
VELQDEAGRDLKVPLLGIPAESDWILLGAYMDKTFMRDVLAYELWREMGYYAPRSRYVELFIRGPLKVDGQAAGERDGAARMTNDEGRMTNEVTWADYAGIYILLEKVKRGKERVKIAKLDPEDAVEPEVTGGYIFKKDRPGIGT